MRVSPTMGGVDRIFKRYFVAPLPVAALWKPATGAAGAAARAAGGSGAGAPRQVTATSRMDRTLRVARLLAHSRLARHRKCVDDSTSLGRVTGPAEEQRWHFSSPPPQRVRTSDSHCSWSAPWSSRLPLFC